MSCSELQGLRPESGVLRLLGQLWEQGMQCVIL